MESRSVLYRAAKKARENYRESMERWAGSDHPSAGKIVKLHEGVYKDLVAAYKAAGGRRPL